MCLLVCARASWRVRVVAEHLGVLGLDQGAASGFAALLRGFLRGLSMTLWAMTLAHSSSVILNASRHTRPWRGAAGALAKMIHPAQLRERQVSRLDEALDAPALTSSELPGLSWVGRGTA